MIIIMYVTAAKAASILATNKLKGYDPEILNDIIISYNSGEIKQTINKTPYSISHE